MRWGVLLLLFVVLTFSGCKQPPTFIDSPRPLLPTIDRPKVDLPEEAIKKMEPTDRDKVVDSVFNLVTSFETQESVIKEYNKRTIEYNKKIVEKLGLTPEALKILSTSVEDPVPVEKGSVGK